MIDELHQQDHLPVTLLCQTLGVSRSAWYAWQQDELGQRRREDNQLIPLIRKIFWAHKRRFGARRIVKELAKRKQPCSRERAARLMDKMGLKAIRPRSFRPQTTNSQHQLGYSPNLLLDAPPPTGIDQLWVGDITYIPLKEGGFLYLAVVMDRYSRRIVGWDLQDHMRESLVTEALRKAIRSRRPQSGMIHHSDRGGQYAGTTYRGILGRSRMLQSMSRAANCYDNAFMESCFGTIKRELEMEVYENSEIARKEVLGFIRYYNTRRLHSALDYLTPIAFEAAL